MCLKALDLDTLLLEKVYNTSELWKFVNAWPSCLVRDSKQFQHSFENPKITILSWQKRLSGQKLKENAACCPDIDFAAVELLFQKHLWGPVQGCRDLMRELSELLLDILHVLCPS